MLEVSHVNVNYGKSRVITDVSFTLNRGRKLVVLGRNGVGKTTLMKCIMGLLPVEGKGTLKLENKNITKMPAYMHNQMGIGYVPQGREIIPDFTVRENLELRAGLLPGTQGAHEPQGRRAFRRSAAAARHRALPYGQTLDSGP